MTRPSIATFPASSCRVASSRHSAVNASGTTPPNCPECSPSARVDTVTSQAATPRSDVVSDGLPTSQLTESATT